MSRLQKLKAKLQVLYDNKGKIFEGLKNSVVKNEFVENVAKARWEICMNCEQLDGEGSKCLVKGTQPCCGACGCKLHFKVRSLSSDCGDTKNPKWFAVLTQEEEDDLELDDTEN